MRLAVEMLVVSAIIGCFASAIYWMATLFVTYPDAELVVQVCHGERCDGYAVESYAGPAAMSDCYSEAMTVQPGLRPMCKGADQ